MRLRTLVAGTPLLKLGLLSDCTGLRAGDVSAPRLEEERRGGYQQDCRNCTWGLASSPPPSWPGPDSLGTFPLLLCTDLPRMPCTVASGVWAGT